MVHAQSCLGLLGGAVSVLLASVLALYIVFFIYDGRNVKTISGVVPLNGEVTVIPGLGVGITAIDPTHEVEVANTGVVTVNGLSSVVGTGDIIIAAGAGVGVGSAGSTVTISNTGVLSTIAGAGIGVSSATGDVTISNTGVLSNIGGTGISVDVATGDVTFTNDGVVSAIGGTGISVDVATGDVTFSNDGVLTVNSLPPTAGGDLLVAAGSGLTVLSAGNTVTLSHTLADQVLLPHPDPLGPLIQYDVVIGFLPAVAMNVAWRTGLSPGFPVPFIPGSFGDSGQGDVGGVAWTVPAIGSYHIDADCSVTPSAFAPDDYQSATIALTLGAISEDPLAGGVIPRGAYSTLDLSAGATAALIPAFPQRIALSTTFQAGCPGCAIPLGAALNVHAHVDHAGAGGPVDANFYCRLQVVRTS